MLPSTPGECDAYLVTGSSAGVYDALPWITPLIGFLAGLITMGHLIAAAFFAAGLLQVVAMTSPDGRYDQLYLSNYATINIIDQLKRIPGIGDVVLFTPSDYSMKVWLNTDRMTSFGLTPNDIAIAQTLLGSVLEAGEGSLARDVAPFAQPLDAVAADLVGIDRRGVG